MDRSADGQQQIASQLRRDLERATAFDTSGLSHATRTSLEVVRSAYTTALEGFAMPYGDVPVGGWRITPYVVIQNVGAYLDVPRMLDAEHRIEQPADAEAYLARLQSYATQLAGERGRIQAARARGLVPPAFLLDKALAQVRLAITSTRARAARSWRRSSGARRGCPARGPHGRGRLHRRRSPRHSSSSSRSCRRSARWPRAMPACGRDPAARSTTGGR